MKHALLMLLASFVYISCGYNNGRKLNETSQVQTTSTNKNDIVKLVKLKGDTIDFGNSIISPVITALSDEHFLIRGYGENYFNVFEWDTSQNRLVNLGGFLKKGKGPTEMISPTVNIDKERKIIFVLDFNGNISKLIKIPYDKIEKIFNKEEWMEISFTNLVNGLYFPSFVAANDTSIIVLGSSPASNNMLSIVNLSNLSTKEIPYTFPNTSYEQTNSMNVLNHLVYGINATIEKRPNGNELLYACSHGKFAEIITVRDYEVINHINISSIIPKYTSKDNANPVFSNDCLQGYTVYVTSNCIYLLDLPLTKEDINKGKNYKGYPFYYSDKLLVYNWDGKLVNTYLLDAPICTFVVDAKDNALIGMTNDKNGDIIVKKYTLI